MFPELIKLKGTALDLFFPKWCIGCGREGGFICASCRKSISEIQPPVCPRCGRPQPGGDLCSGCVHWKSDVEGIRSPFMFDGVIRKAIHQLKYGNLRSLAAPLADMLDDYLVANPIPADVLVPVPLHPRKLRERGYNQSALLARELGKRTGLAVTEGCLIRRRHTLPQAKTSSVDERRSNITGAFACCDQRLRDKQVLLIDDVSTSGATLDACAAALKVAGAGSVWGLVVAREI